MSDRRGDARLYGMPDSDNRQRPGEEGFRGEQSAQRQGRPCLTSAIVHFFPFVILSFGAPCVR